MAALPLQYPDLALYLADESSTPIISSAGSALALHEEEEEEEELQEHNEAVHGAAVDSTNQKPPSRRQRAAALDALTGTALRAREAAARLGLGLDYADTDADAQQRRARTAMSAMAAWGMTPPEHVVVTYNTGAVLVESFLDPHQQQPVHLASAQTPPQTTSSAADFQEPDLYTYADENGDSVGHAANCGPLLVGLVVAPGEQSMRDARRATAQLQRIGRAVQRDWVAETQR